MGKRIRIRGAARLMLVEAMRGEWAVSFAGKRLVNGFKRTTAIRVAAALARQGATELQPITLKVKNIGNGRFSLERTYPRSCDPQTSRG